MMPFLLAQVVSGGGPFDPLSITGCKLWLKADQITGLSDTDPVSTWSDQSGNGNDATSSLTARPLYRTSILNGKPAVRFDGSNDVLNTSFTFPTAHTLFLVYTQTSKSMIGSSGGDCYLFRSTTWWPNVNNGTITITSTIFGMTNLLTTTWSGSVGKIYLNTVDKTGSASSPASPIGAILLGRSFDGYFTGDLMEVLIYNSVLGSTDRGNVETYLKAKYAI